MGILRVIIADGRRILREGISAALERHQDLRVVGDAPDLATAARLLPALVPDVLIVNWRATTDVEFRAALGPALAASPDTAVVASFMSPSPQVLRAALAAGVRGCLSKECGLDDLVACVRAVAAGETHVGPSLRTLLLNHFVLPTLSSAAPAITDRERGVLRLIASGRSTKEIAAELAIGAKTVETHRRRLMQKLGRHSVAELTQYALIEGLIEPTPSALAR